MKTNKFFIALTLLMLGVVLLLPPVFVSADPNDAVKGSNNSGKTAGKKSSSNIDETTVNPIISISNPPSKDDKGISRYCSAVNALIINDGYWKYEEQFLTCTTEGKSADDKVVNIEVNMLLYRNLGSKDKQGVMKDALSQISSDSTAVSRTNKNKIYNSICAVDETTSSLVRQLSNDVRADFYTAYADWFKPWSGPLGVFLGGMSLLIFTTMTISIVLDIAFITIPLFQSGMLGLMEKAEQSKSDGKIRIKLVSIEAIDAVKAAESKAGSQFISPIKIYFAHRTKQLIMVALCLMYLVSGQIYELIAWIIDYFNMAVDAIMK